MTWHQSHVDRGQKAVPRWFGRRSTYSQGSGRKTCKQRNKGKLGSKDISGTAKYSRPDNLLATNSHFSAQEFRVDSHNHRADGDERDDKGEDLHRLFFRCLRRQKSGRRALEELRDVERRSITDRGGSD